MSDTAGGSTEPTFGQALAELDGIVAQLEGGQLELEESIERYQRGVDLLKSLQSKLTDAQQKVTMLIGELEEDVSATEAAPPSPAPGAASASSSEEVPF